MNYVVNYETWNVLRRCIRSPQMSQNELPGMSIFT